MDSLHYKISQENVRETTEQQHFFWKKTNSVHSIHKLCCISVLIPHVCSSICGFIKQSALYKKSIEFYCYTWK